MALPEVVSRDQWLEARVRLLAEEKELTRRRDALNSERRRLPMVRIEKNYVFDGPQGPVTLAKLEAYRARHGWTVPWYSSFGSDFNYDFQVTLDEAVPQVQYNYRPSRTCSVASAPARCPGLAASCGTAARSTTPTRPTPAALTTPTCPTPSRPDRSGPELHRG